MHVQYLPAAFMHHALAPYKYSYANPVARKCNWHRNPDSMLRRSSWNCSWEPVHGPGD